MFAMGTPLFVLAGLGGLLVVLGVGTFLFQAGCALADVPERGYFRSLPVYSAAIIVCLPLAAALVWFAGCYDADPKDWFGNLRIAAAIGALLLTWVLSAGIFAMLLASSLRKGLLIAGIELLLSALLAALVSAFVLVILALVQIGMRMPPAKVSRDAQRNPDTLRCSSRLRVSGQKVADSRSECPTVFCPLVLNEAETS